ncbi:uncharacterized protein [Aegilops tauschii subsp. strangulata]|uniref:uncharacterized protein n=1 Tax=Aegilops tauschii subsp. strangulata TaxID=200361 RepID=UPI00098B8B28|nr:uncharacterized protein LOC109744991 [Aegilops tauschii subsp. strangulata]
MGKAARAAGETPLRRRAGLPEEIIFSNILVRLPPKSLLCCRAVCRAWRRATSKRRFLLAHHTHQPAHPVFLAGEEIFGVPCHNIRAFDHRANDVQTVAQLDEAFDLEASCDGLLVLSKFDYTARFRSFSVCNPATREHAPLRCPPWDFHIVGMYAHRPTGEYRLILQRTIDMKLSEGQIGCYVFLLGSDQPPRYIGWPETGSWTFDVPVRVDDSLHWYSQFYLGKSNPPQHQRDNTPVIVFDTIDESFRLMHDPVVSTQATIFDMDGTLGIYRRNYEIKQIDVDPFMKEKETIGIWVLRNYESEVWDKKYRIKLPLAEIRDDFGNHDDYCLEVVSGDGDVFMLLLLGRYLIRVDSNGKLLENSNIGRENPRMTKWLLKQSLVQHTFFPALEGYAVNGSPWLPKLTHL